MGLFACCGISCCPSYEKKWDKNTKEYVKHSLYCNNNGPFDKTGMKIACPDTISKKLNKLTVMKEDVLMNYDLFH